MTTTAQRPKLTLVSAQLGGQARLQAGLEQLFAPKDVDPGLRIVLFHGPRPSQIELDTGIFIFEGADPSTAMLGCWAFSRGDYVSVGPRPSFILGDQPLNSGQPGVAVPQDPACMVPGDDLDYFHVVFPRHAKHPVDYCNYSAANLSEAMRSLGNGYAPTWGLVSLNGGAPSSWTSIFPNAPSTAAHGCTVERYDGKSQLMSVYNAAAPYLHYITVGDWQEEPAANLTLYKGAQAGLTAKPTELVLQRLRLRMSPLISKQAAPAGQ